MLNKTHISNIVIHSDEWFAGRLAKFTSSEWHYLMGSKGLGDAGYRYIWRKVGERLTGVPCRKEITTEQTEWGHIYEPENLRNFGKKMGLEFLVTQKLIVNPAPDTMEGSTPDAIWVINESVDKSSYNVSTIEAKCPPTFDNYIELWNCETPEQVKKISSAYYWQVLHQIRACDCLKGYLSIYHPQFHAGELNVIEFKKVNLVPEFSLMEARSKEACQIFDDQIQKMITGKKFTV